MITAIPARTGNGGLRIAALVALAPPLVAADTLLRGLALGAVTLGAAWGGRLGAHALRGAPPAAARAAVCLLVAAGCIGLAQLTCRALLFDVHLALGASLPLALAGAALAGHALAAPTCGPQPGLGLAPALIFALLGAAREVLGRGELLSRPLAAEPGGFTLLATPAGAFLLLAIVAAAVTALAARRRAAPGAP